MNICLPFISTQLVSNNYCLVNTISMGQVNIVAIEVANILNGTDYVIERVEVGLNIRSDLRFSKIQN